MRELHKEGQSISEGDKSHVRNSEVKEEFSSEADLPHRFQADRPFTEKKAYSVL
ncbi:MAG: hypothetical protein ACI33O_00320 [Bhargavaea sp.]